MFLPLAERMVEKMVKEEKIEAEAEVWTVSFTILALDSLFVPFHTCLHTVFTFCWFYQSLNFEKVNLNE